MSNYYISKCCGSQVENHSDWIQHGDIGHPGGRQWYVCTKCKKECEVTAQIDKPGGVPEPAYIGGVGEHRDANKTEQIKEILFDFWENIPAGSDDERDYWIEKTTDQLLQKLSEQKQAIIDIISAYDLHYGDKVALIKEINK